MGRLPCDKKGLKKGPWTQEENDKLINYIHIHGPGNWRTLPQNAGLQRYGKSCRLRWTNYLRPDIKRGRFSFEEEESIIQLHSILGNKWSAIAARLPGRTDNEIKNYWNTHIRKRLLKMGIDPVTHSPRLDHLDLSSIHSSNQLNFSSLLGLQTLLNPDLARFLTTLLVSNLQNHEVLLQKLHQKQDTNPEMQIHYPDHVQPSTQYTSSNFPLAPLIHQTHETNMVSCQDFQQNLVALSIEKSDILPNYLSNAWNQIKLQDPLKIPNFPSTDNSAATSQNVTFDSLLSTPMSSPTPMNSSSLVNNNSEDEKRSYFSDIFNFEIPATLDLDDFM